MDLPTQLLAFWIVQQPDAAQATITHFEAITDGWETEVYKVTLATGAGIQRLILRLYPSLNAASKAEHEFQGIQTLYELGYPVPQPFYCSLDAGWLGKPFILMQQIEGEPLINTLGTAHASAYLRRFIELFVRLHRLDFPHNVPPLSAGSLLAAWRTSDIATYPEFAPLWDWLEDALQSVRFEQLSVLHRDYHPANVLVTRDDQLVVIDWSSWAVGDYRMDLAWTLLLFSTFGEAALREALLLLYQHHAGRTVEHIEVFEVLACLRRLGDMVRSLHLGADHSGMRPDTVQIMKSQAEHYQKVYAILQARTGLALPLLQQRLAGLGG